MSTSKKIAEKLFALPSSPGVYLMTDEGGSVLYVGKVRGAQKPCPLVLSHLAEEGGQDQKVGR